MVHAPPPPASTVPVRVNLFSDTQTKPSAAMRAAMMEAEVGDEQLGADPTVNALCERMAALLGKEAAVFMPSGTMCNQVSIATQCRPGDEILAHPEAHIISSEGGGTAAISGAQVTAVPGEGGQFTLDALRAALRPRSRNAPPQRMVAVEQTANLGGGTVWRLDVLHAVAELAHAQGMVTHMDGARLMNAAVAAGIPAHEMAAGYDSVWLDFTKGLGAPLGAVLAGSSAFIGEAWRWKQRMGGALRQGGISAAACLYALDHNIDRLADDHANARILARDAGQIEGLNVVAPATNLVFIDTAGTGIGADVLARRMQQAGVLISVMGRFRLRACTHLDVAATDIPEAVAALRDAVALGTDRAAA